MHYFGGTTLGADAVQLLFRGLKLKSVFTTYLQKGYRIQNEKNKSSGTDKAVFHLHLLCHGCINGDMSTSEVWYRDNFIVEMYPSYSKRRFSLTEEASKRAQERRGMFNCHIERFPLLCLFDLCPPPPHSLLTERLKHNQMGLIRVSSISKNKIK